MRADHFAARAGFDAFRITRGSFRRAGKPGSTAGRDACRYGGVHQQNQ
jgi:hypothetical protein